MRIAVDAMGGDYAPGVLVEGAVYALSEFGEDVDILLVGDEQVLQREMERCAGVSLDAVSDRISIVHASEVVGMSESPAAALQKKPDSSIGVCVRLQKGGRADALISAGNTGAAVVSSQLALGRLNGVSRPAIANPFPSEQGRCLLLDVGANSSCKPFWLLQFAVMGSSYVNHIFGIRYPKVGLLNVGEESSKGHDLMVEAHALLSASDLNFIGNVEGRDILKGVADVVVCDGFVGNIILKFAESIEGFLRTGLRKRIMMNWLQRLGAFLLAPALREFKKEMDYEEYGGAPLLGVDGVTIICHGRSSPKAIKNAIGVAQRMVQGRVNDHIKEQLQRISGGT